MNNNEKVEVFSNELSWIQDDIIRNFTAKMIKELPDYFFSVPASSTGKYHPKYALGNGGLVRHTKAAVLLAHTMLELEQYKNEFKEYQEDIVLASLILHDGLKQGSTVEGSGYTNKNHPEDMAFFVRKKWVDEFGANSKYDFYCNLICNCIASHMGQWDCNGSLPVPNNRLEKIVHLCDYFASREFIDINFPL